MVKPNYTIPMKKILILLFFCFHVVVFAQHKQPNIIFILSDDHAYQAIGAYGNKLISTPNIDRLAKSGALFNNAIVSNAICGPSRAAFITGQYSHKNGYKVNDGVLDTNQRFLPEILSQNGYQTAWIGKWHLGSLPKGFDYWNVMPVQGHYFNPDFINQKNDTLLYHGYVTEVITELTKKYLKDRNPDKPFFLVVGEKATHREWLPDLQDLGAYDSVKFPLPATFYDDYKGRTAAAKQLMSVGDVLTLKTDLKINQPFGEKPKVNNQPAKPAVKGKEIEESMMRYYQQGEYARMDSVQSKAYRNYYGQLAKEFAQLNLTGNALKEWKFQRYMKDYYATAKSLDRNIGEILDYLDKNGLSENTIVIYASDQGFYLGEHGWFDKRFIYEESLRTPFIIRMPQLPALKDKKVNQIISNVDWAPTILDFSGIAKPDFMQGKSFLPVLKNPQIKNWSKDGAYYHYYEYPGPHYVSPHFGIRTDDYVLVRFYKGTEAWELYDLKKDPSELNNIVDDKHYNTIKNELKKKLNKLIVAYDDQEALKVFNQAL
ncbi:sulfatase [Pedobacter kyungheensis]|uniref:Sulfatase n=1 Tax=Pedobacter kyungheensis TaxID=1069985 RepID=A0A0C1D1Z6_9SPHI|nr:sulfatase [Pedobacter kyungheensis]